MGKWLSGCEICNIGLVTEVNNLKEAGLSERAACRKLAEMAEKKFKTPMWSEKVILNRYRYHYGLDRNSEVSEFQTPTPSKPAPIKGLQGPVEKNVEKPAAKPKAKPSKKQPPVMEAVVIEPDELGAEYLSDAQKLVANAQKPPLSELEKAEKTIIKAARLLDDIVEGRLKDNGTDNDRLTAESIKRHGPGIITSFIQLGIDVFKVYDFYTGKENQNGTESNIKRNLRIQGNVEIDRD